VKAVEPGGSVVMIVTVCAIASIGHVFDIVIVVVVGTGFMIVTVPEDDIVTAVAGMLLLVDPPAGWTVAGVFAARVFELDVNLLHVVCAKTSLGVKSTNRWSGTKERGNLIVKKIQ